MSEAYVLDAVRAPFGRYGGALAGVRPDDLGAHAVRALLARAPALDPARIDDVMFGNANGAGEDNRDVARMAVLLAGLPTSVPGATVNRLCGSSLDATIQASRAIETGDASLVLVGGVESMSRAPWVMLKPEKGFPAGGAELHSTTLGWRMVNPEMDPRWTISLGESTEKLAAMYGISRAAQDEFAVRSHHMAHAAWEGGFYDDWVVPVPGTELERDEGIRPDTTPEKLARLRPAFAREGTITAGNASPLNDGAGAVLLGDAAGAAATDLEPIARIAGRGTFAVDPDVFGIGPVEAANRALARAGVGWGDLELVELNEAFAAQSLACLAEWTELDPERVNVYGAPARRLRRAHPWHPRPRPPGARRRLGPRRDLHRRGPGPRRRAGGGAVTNESEAR
jgi:acetyl-CoA acetyltransferase family protein